MLAKTGDVVVQKVPVIRLSVFLHFFLFFPFVFCTAYIWGPTEESERLLSQGLLSATSPRKTIAVRVAVRLRSRALQGQRKKHFAATEKQCTNSLEGSRKDFLSLPLGHSYLFSFLFLAYDLF
ncbi:ASB_HP2_G0000080.mRNA.1.CDS.1 [Saccharomyces cerevisiae]|nr:ASB_HP2_G0000080.mRNA.1.CDS.1 [Saccharomyces cerevisiae]CAI6378491.1 ASB_HP2_G0000080.mRNA.1.CDS.1 [Saccharomyces cerevisiae]